MIKVESAEVSLDGKPILHGISFEIEEGNIGGYIGSNGAGKTTTLRLLTGGVPLNSGSVTIAGIDMIKNPLEAKRKLGYVPEAGTLYDSLSPVEFLSFAGRMYNVPEEAIRRRTDALLVFWGLAENADQRMTSFSKGMKQKVLISASVLHNPSVLLLDEPLNGLDAPAVMQFRGFLKSWATAGKTILYSSHILDAVEKIVDTVVVIRDGHIISTGSSAELLEKTQTESLEMAFTNLMDPADIEAQTADLMLAFT